MVHGSPALTADERAALVTLSQTLGIAGAARRVGLSRTAFMSLLLDRARKGTVLQFRHMSMAQPLDIVA